MCDITGSKNEMLCLHNIKGCELCKIEVSKVEIEQLFNMHSHVMQQAHSCSLLINSINESYQRLVSFCVVIQMNKWSMVTFDSLF